MTALIAIYRDEATAHEVATELRHHGASSDALRVCDWSDARTSSLAEMDAEVAEGWGSPGLGAFVTAEMMRGALLFTVVLGGLGLVVGIALGLLFYTGDA